MIVIRVKEVMTLVMFCLWLCFMNIFSNVTTWHLCKGWHFQPLPFGHCPNRRLFMGASSNLLLGDDDVLLCGLMFVIDGVIVQSSTWEWSALDKFKWKQSWIWYFGKACIADSRDGGRWLLSQYCIYLSNIQKIGGEKHVSQKRDTYKAGWRMRGGKRLS